MGKTQEKVLNYLKNITDGSTRSTHDIATGTNLSMPQVKNALLRLRKTGLVMYHKDLGKNFWKATPEFQTS